MICRAGCLSAELLGCCGDPDHVRLMIDDRFRDLSGKPLQLLVCRDEFQVALDGSGDLSCRCIGFRESLLRRQHNQTIGQKEPLVNHASVSRKPLTPPMEPNPQTANAAGNPFNQGL